MSLRKAIFWAHLAVGVTAALVVLLLAVTGVILTYEAQLDEWALGDYRADPPAPDVAPLGIDELLARVTAEQPAGLVASVALKRDPREPAVVELDGATVHVDRFTGARLGDGDTRTRRFLRSVLYWHRWFALEGEYRIVGRTVVAVSNVGFLFLLVSGIYLWWPSTGSRAAWRRALWFRRGLGGRARDFNWHNVIGFWSFFPLAVIVFSGAHDLVSVGRGTSFIVLRATRRRSSSRPDRGRRTLGVTPRSGPTRRFRWSSCRRWPPRRAPRRRNGERSRSTCPRPFTPPSWSRSTAGTAVSRRRARTCCSTGPPASWSRAPAIRPSRRGFKVRRWLRFAHTGEVYGVIGQSIAGIVSLGVAVMVWTGLAMSWRRFFGSARRR